MVSGRYWIKFWNYLKSGGPSEFLLVIRQNQTDLKYGRQSEELFIVIDRFSFIVHSAP